MLQPPQSDPTSLDDFWVFLHFLLELKAAYGFLLRDMDSLLAEYPKVGVALKHFARGVIASFELYLHALHESAVLAADSREAPRIARNLAVIVFFSEKLDGLQGSVQSADDSALRTAEAVLSLLRPLVMPGLREHFDVLLSHYGSR